jgi:phosphoglycerol transferase MdoB-like AlkP superfamily enzyme
VDARKPFFAIIHTSGNHRPYTIPEDSRGFEPVEADDDEVRKYGFISAREFNSFRFMDHSIGHFMDEAAKEDYFNNTIFVFFGDHGLPGTAGHMPAAEWKLGLTRYHVPLVIYAPWLIKEGRAFDRVASEVDVLPTVASLASVPHLNTTLGRDLLAEGFDSMRYAFTVANQSTVPEIGLIGDEFYFVMNSDGSGKRLHRLDSGDPRENVSAQFPDTALEMERLCRGLYETSRYMPYFNAPEQKAPSGPKDLPAPGNSPVPPGEGKTGNHG